MSPNSATKCRVEPSAPFKALKQPVTLLSNNIHWKRKGISTRACARAVKCSFNWMSDSALKRFVDAMLSATAACQWGACGPQL